MNSLVQIDSLRVYSFNHEFVVLTEVELLLVGDLGPVEIEVFSDFVLVDDLYNLDMSDGLGESLNVRNLFRHSSSELPFLEEGVFIDIFNRIFGNKDDLAILVL